MKAFIVITSISLLTICSQKLETPGAETAAPVTPTATANVQEHTIEVAVTFTPASVTLKAGQPARLHFKRTDKPTCADEVVIPAANIRQKLEKNKTTTVEFTPQAAGTMEFACGMKMMKGVLVVQ
jgi:plastocyanin domain-containing protein